MANLQKSILEDRFPKLTELHQKLGADFIDYNGYQLPYQYSDGAVSEHHFCRTKASLFDVSYLIKQVLLIGHNIPEKLEVLIPSAVRELHSGKARYTVLTNDHGGIRDDLILCHGDNHYYMLLNSAMNVHNVEYLRAHLHGVEVIELEDQALFDIQGPEAESILGTIFPEVEQLKFMETQQVKFNNAVCRISRFGLTGEDGFEISVPVSDAQDIALTLLSNDNLQPAGIAARESLRVEAGFNLYGSDIDARTSPIEAQIPWVIQKRRVKEANFLGAKQILQELKNGPTRKLVGIIPGGFKPLHIGSDLFSQDDKKIGKITSSIFSPTIGAPIANGYVLSEYANIGEDIVVYIDDKPTSCRISKRPFVAHKYKR